jgi:ubiquinone/menaquinone biosynthesis C-methylase UbiE
MTHETASYTPALGHRVLTPAYDAAVALFTREARWRKALVRQIAPRAKQTVADVGCGTGTLAVMLKRHAPSVSVYGFDPDPEALDRAERKARAASAIVNFTHADMSDIAAKLAAVRPAHIVSSLVFHQVPLQTKRDLLAAMAAALQPGGQLHIADYGWQRTRAMRLAFRIVQNLDGFEDTQPNADGCMPVLMHQAGFANVAETSVIPTITGSISLYRAVKP